MQKIRFLHATPFMKSVDISLGDQKKRQVLNLNCGELTAYLDNRYQCGKSVPFRVYEAGTNEIIHKSDIMIHRGLQTVVMKEGGVLVLDQDVEKLHPGYYQFDFANVSGFGPVNVMQGENIIFQNVENDQRVSTVMKLQPFQFAPIVIVGKGVNVVERFNFTSKSRTTFFLTSNACSGMLVKSSNVDRSYTQDQLQSNFSLQAYMGKWYQIADIPQFYEMGCVRSVAEYTLMENGVKILNKCFDAQGAVRQTAYGKGTVVNFNYPQAIEVQIEKLVPPPPSNGGGPPDGIVIASGVNYIVHQTDYTSFALVGSPDRRSLYFLSRTPSMRKQLFNHLMVNSERLGYDVSAVKLSCGSLD